MEYRYIGTSGLRVTPICLGTMTMGHMSDRTQSYAVMDRAYEAGINFFDTAELYPVPPSAELHGVTEEIIGDWLQERNIPRDSLIIASKVAGAASGWFAPPVRHGLTAIDRFHIETAIEGSLKRLKTDYIDLYQVHWPDTVVPIEESLEALDRLVESGKVRYIGTSNDSAYGVTKANEVSKHYGYARFQSVQNNFSLLNRRFFDELANVCRREKISCLPYSPIAGGVLSGKYQNGAFPSGARFTDYWSYNNPRQRAMAERFINPKTLAATDRYIQIAQEAGMSVTQLAVAWSMHWDFVASTMIGARTVEQLDEILKAFEIKLGADVIKACDEVHEDILYPMG